MPQSNGLAILVLGDADAGKMVFCNYSLLECVLIVVYITY